MFIRYELSVVSSSVDCPFSYSHSSSRRNRRYGLLMRLTLSIEIDTTNLIWIHLILGIPPIRMFFLPSSALPKYLLAAISLPRDTCLQVTDSLSFVRFVEKHRMPILYQALMQHPNKFNKWANHDEGFEIKEKNSGQGLSNRSQVSHIRGRMLQFYKILCSECLQQLMKRWFIRTQG